MGLHKMITDLCLPPSSCLQKLQDYLARYSRQYDQLVAFKPTGWTFSQQVESLEDIQPHVSGNISIYGTHLSFVLNIYILVLCLVYAHSHETFNSKQ